MLHFADRTVRDDDIGTLMLASNSFAPAMSASSYQTDVLLLRGKRARHRPGPSHALFFTDDVDDFVEFYAFKRVKISSSST